VRINSGLVRLAGISIATCPCGTGFAATLVAAKGVMAMMSLLTGNHFNMGLPAPPDCIRPPGRAFASWKKRTVLARRRILDKVAQQDKPARQDGQKRVRP
jgi:hypothetical protein